MTQDELVLALRGLQCTMMHMAVQVMDAAATEAWAKDFGRLYGVGEELREQADTLYGYIFTMDESIDKSEDIALLEIFETLHSWDYTVDDVKSLYGDWLYHNVK